MRYEKLAPGLMLILDSYQNLGSRALSNLGGSFGVVSPAPGSSAPRTIVFIKGQPAATYDHLTHSEIIVNQRSGMFRTAILPITRLEDLTEEAQIERIYPTQYLRPSLDVAAPLVHIPAFRAKSGLDGYRVVVGVVDSGIDGSHPAFAGRIRSVWDQTVQGGNGGAEGPYGRELIGTDVANATDTNSHGTHVAGIAAGVDPIYCGVAPGSTLVCVKTDFNNAHIADGIRYIFRKAQELESPAVINLSLGGHGDAHDGTDALSQIIDDQSGPGKIVCCAAGNEGHDDIHAQATFATGEMKSILFRVPSSAQNVTPITFLNGWYPGTDDLEIAIESRWEQERLSNELYRADRPHGCMDCRERR